MRNPQKNSDKKASKGTNENLRNEQGDDDDDEDNYSDEEIANDPDEGDDGTNKLM